MKNTTRKRPRCEYCQDTGTMELGKGCVYCRGEKPRPTRPIPPSVQAQRSTALDAVVSAVAAQLNLKGGG